MRRESQGFAIIFTAAAVTMAGAIVGVRWVLGWMQAHLTGGQLATWALVATVAVALAGALGYGLGQKSGKRKHYDDGYHTGYRAGRAASADTIERLKEEATERAGAYLDGAKRGLGLAERLTATRQAARAAEPAPQVVVLPNVTAPFRLRAANDHNVIEV
ncbi:MAG: hypothetical protein ACOYZ7_01200 [Chloroflexota bacterium]